MISNIKKILEPQMSLPMCAHVLVEEEPEVRNYWQASATKKKLALFTFSSASAFLSTLFFWNSSTRFYFDQDMYEVRGQGVELAKIVRATLPDSVINLVTVYPSDHFLAELSDDLITNVFGKYPEPFERPGFDLYKREFLTFSRLGVRL